MRVFKTNPARILTACLLAAGLGLFTSSIAVAQTYVPSAPPAVSADGSAVSFNGLIPGDTAVATFALSNGSVVTVTGTVDAAGNVVFATPANATGVTVSSSAGAQTSSSFAITQPAAAPTAVPAATATPIPAATAVAAAPAAADPPAAAAPTAVPAAAAPSSSSGLGDAPDNLAFADGDLGEAPDDLAYSGSSAATPAALGIALIILGLAALYVSGHRPKRFAGLSK